MFWYNANLDAEVSILSTFLKVDLLILRITAPGKRVPDVKYLLAFLQSRQQITTRTRSKRQTEDMDQKAICSGESGSHQN